MIDLTTTITVHNVPGWALDNEMLAAVLKRAQERFVGEARIVDVYPQQRQSNGWLEWLLRVHFNSGTIMTIGAIQRTRGAEVEFHS